MKRLLCLLSGMNAGGAETFLMKIYRKLDKSKYQMDFCINISEQCFYEEEIVAMGGRIYRIPSKSENLKEFKSQLSKIIRENKYQYVMRVTSSAMGFLDLKIAKKAGAKVCVARSSNASDGGGLKAFAAHYLGRLLFSKYVDVKIAPSDLAAKYTFGKKEYEKGRVNILHNAVDLDSFYFDEEARRQIRKEFKISDDVKVFGHIGRFTEQKNHEFLVEIFDRIHKKDSSAMLLLVGTGSLENKIHTKVRALGLKDNVIFTGVRNDIPKLLSAMDAFVFPSFFEGMPNTVIEAQACGLSCVIADTITKEADITGIVQYLPIGDADLWAETAIRASDFERKDMSDAFVKQGYCIEEVAKQFAYMIMEHD